MELEVLQENLKKGLELPLRAISTRPQLPVLANVLLEARKDGLYVGGTDLEMGVRVRVGAKIEKEGSITVPGRMFFEFVGKLPRGKVFLKLDKDVLRVESGGYKASFQTISGEEYPKIIDDGKVDWQWELEGEDLGEGIRKVLYAVAKDSMRPILTGVLWEKTRRGLRLVGTDGFRLAIKDVKASFRGEEWEEVVVPARVLGELGKVGKEKVFLGWLEESKQVVFKYGEVIIVGQVLEGKFPDYKKIVPDNFKVRIKVNKEEMEEAVAVAMVFARDNSNVLRWEVGGDELVIKAESPEQGENISRVEVEKEENDEKAKIAFNGKFVGDFLQNAQKERIVLGLNDSLSPGEFREEDEDDWVYLVMPVNV